MARRQTRDSVADLIREITIIGGGLAGLSLGVALRQRGIPVTVLEAGNYPRHKVCGEFISGVSRATLDTLGISGLFDDALQHRTLSWHQGGRLIHRDTLKSPALGISRHCLDERLRLQFETLGGRLSTGVRARPEPRDGLVWAAGRKPRNGPWIGLKAHVRSLPTTADLEMHAGKNGYVGLAAVEDAWTNVCGLFRLDRTLKASPGDLLPRYIEAGGNPNLAAALRAAEWRPGSCSAVAGFALGRQTLPPGLLGLGDAESVIPPFTGNGMSMAFQAAECAIQPLLNWSHGHETWENSAESVRTSLQHNFRRRLTVAHWIHPFLTISSINQCLASLSSLRLLPFHSALHLLR